MNRNKVLLINTQFVEIYISGFTNRFIGLWCYISNQPKDALNGEVHWLTNKSLWKKFFPGKSEPKTVSIITADRRYFKYTSRLFYPFYVLFIYYKNRCTSVHVATSIIDSLYLVRLFNFFRIPHCFTFASNSLEMASYDSIAVRRSWEKLFSLAKNIEVLNPTNSVQPAGARKHISPTSFPYFIELNHIPLEKFTNPRRRDVIVFCGSLIPQKNPLFTLEGYRVFLQEFIEEYPEVQLLIVGKGHLQSKVETEIEILNQNYGRKVAELIADTHLIKILSESKLFLSLQDYDNYPSQSLMEAMTFCNSVISFDNGDTYRLVRKDFNNILLADKSPAKLASAIHDILSGWKLNKNNRQLILEEFSPKIFSDYFFSLHQSISQSNANAT